MACLSMLASCSEQACSAQLLSARLHGQADMFCILSSKVRERNTSQIAMESGIREPGACVDHVQDYEVLLPGISTQGSS